jgi:enoyl-[acyl-carrier protein] reductase I
LLSVGIRQNFSKSFSAVYIKDKNIMIMGVANERSLAWGVAKSLFKVGANLIFTYRKERSLGKLNKLLSEYNFEAKLIVQ